MKRSSRLSFRQVWRGVRGMSLRAGSEEGAAMAELIWMLPFLSMLLVGIIFGGITFYNYVELANAVNAGARELGENGRIQGTYAAACTLVNTAVQTAAGNLNTNNILPNPVQISFYSGSTCSATTTPLQGDAGTVTATYPCDLPIPFTKVNLCPMQGGSTDTSCTTAYCISATTTVYIE